MLCRDAKAKKLAIGLMSGTSADGIDAVLVEISGCSTNTHVRQMAFVTLPFTDAVRSRILQVAAGNFGGSEAYFQKILEHVKQSVAPSNSVFGEYMCQGKMPQSVRDRYMKMKTQPEHPANIDALIENFDRALSHPDEDDLERLRKIVLDRQ